MCCIIGQSDEFRAGDGTLNDTAIRISKAYIWYGCADSRYDDDKGYENAD